LHDGRRGFTLWTAACERMGPVALRSESLRFVDAASHEGELREEQSSSWRRGARRIRLFVRPSTTRALPGRATSGFARFR
jgi:hypothetical protein